MLIRAEQTAAWFGWVTWHQPVTGPLSWRILDEDNNLLFSLITFLLDMRQWGWSGITCVTAETNPAEMGMDVSIGAVSILTT